MSSVKWVFDGVTSILIMNTGAINTFLFIINFKT